MILQPLKLGGSPYDIGLGLGRFGRDAVHQRLRPLPLWQSLAARAGSDVAKTMQTQVEAGFPRIWEEIRGLADGLELPVEEVFLWNCRGDFVSPQSVDGCTTVFGPAAEGWLIAHNEDGLPSLEGACGLLQAAPEQGMAFTSFVYPGSIPGHTFAVNAAGLVSTVNNIRPANIPTGLPRQVLARAVLDCASLDEAVDVLSRAGRAGAFHYTLGQVGSGHLLSVEACSSDVVVRKVRRLGGHANHLLDAGLAAAGQRITGSSGSRQHRVDGLLGDGAGLLDESRALAILRDVAGPELPIYRRAEDDPDEENTLATAVFRIGANSVEWRVYCQPDVQHVEAAGSIRPHSANGPAR
ncbi:acyl-CoA--6-aminopenicillanic acid acyl-transferase [Pseudomonas sp. PDM18]|uniref:C45 family autoproteolytic acyltransferase/hydolase n=1 Tax=Pseudomonas sp. PDM18 TaxID=2769253 RepID=UPI00178142A2|nr:C45 family peptidase [Pseudomonas sp. PDM18]MBD9679665.1 acyl-CoA--6-aminopenicillanic acid acyl-transferase [Pseudomonas sp. PDM18]